MIDHLRATIRHGSLEAVTDTELLRRYATDRDEIAFAELVHRHAPAVFALCRRHLNRSADLDDAFQATFVVLARRAGELTQPDRLSGWLCGTADRIARKARRKSAKRAGTEQPLESVAEPSVSIPESETDLKAVLDDELQLLPDEYRQAVLLCDVEQVTRREAAKRLGIPDGTLSNRLTRARAMLGRRLVRRGVTLGIGIGSAQMADAAVPIRLIARTVRQALCDPIPEGIESLVTSGWKPMSLPKGLLAAVVGVSAMSATVVGVLVLTRGVNSTTTTDGEGVKKAEPLTPRTWAVSVEEMAKRPHPKPRVYYERYTRVAVTPNGSRIVMAPNDWSADDSKIIVYDTADWNEVASLDIAPDGIIVSTLAISADGQRIIFKSSSQNEVRVWNTVAKKYEETRLDVKADKYSLRLKPSPDGAVLVGSVLEKRDKRFIHIWDAKSGRVLHTIDLPSLCDNDVTFTDGGKTLAALTATGDFNDPKYTVVEWDLASGNEKKRINLRAAVGVDRGPPLPATIAYTADGKQLVVSGGVRLPEVNLSKVEPNTSINNYPWSGSVWVIDRESGKVVNTLVDCRYDLVRSVRLSADGKKLFVQPTLPSRWDRTFSEDNEFVEIQRWDVATWKLDWVKIVPVTERWKLMLQPTQ